MTENKLKKSDKVVHGEELLMIVKGEKVKKFIYELTAVIIPFLYDLILQFFTVILL